MKYLIPILCLGAISASAATFQPPGIDLIFPSNSDVSFQLSFGGVRDLDDPGTPANEAESISFEAVSGSTWINTGISSLQYAEEANEDNPETTEVDESLTGNVTVRINFTLDPNPTQARRMSDINITFTCQKGGSQSQQNVVLSIVQAAPGEAIDALANGKFEGYLFGLELDSDVYFSPWFGLFSAPASFNGWVYHFDHKSFFFPQDDVLDDGQANFWAFDTGVDSWLFFSEQTYDASTFSGTAKANLYFAKGSQWMFYSPVDVDPRYFFLYVDDQWYTDAELESSNW
jgi:hypothetical protein